MVSRKIKDGLLKTPLPIVVAGERLCPKMLALWTVGTYIYAYRYIYVYIYV